MKSKYQLLDEVRISVEAEKDGVKLSGTRVGVIDQIRAELWMGDCYQSGHHIYYRIVDSTYGCKNPVWVLEIDIIGHVLKGAK